jgi:hypothetical protein
VAELADAQVSEACDGDIVEVQVLSSAPSGVIEKRTILAVRFFVAQNMTFCRHIVWQTLLQRKSSKSRY